MWVFVVIGYLLLVGLAAWFGGGAVMTVELEPWTEEAAA